MQSRAKYELPAFVHRSDIFDQTVISICTRCAATAAKGRTEQDLEDGEKNHVCKKTVCSVPAPKTAS